MNTEIYGGTLTNFGDELMLRRIASELTARIAGFAPVVYPQDLRYLIRAQLGLQHILPGEGRGPLVARAGVVLVESLAPKRLRQLQHLYGVVSSGSVDGLVTLSGFAFSDQWPGAATKAAIKVFRRYVRRGKPVILLPQALGPFRDRESREAFREIVGLADLVFARDDFSLNYAKSAAGDSSKLRRAYDITLVETRAHPTNDDVTKPRVSLVPNQRMIDRASARWSARYLETMTALAQALVERGPAVDVVVHDRAAGDLQLASEIVKRVPSVRLIHLHDPTVARAYLAQAAAVVSSRYHALVGALAHGVPVLGVGWAHKYQGLFEDFGLSNWCVSEEDSIDQIVDKALALCSDDTNSAIRRAIDQVLPNIAAATSAMWDDVSHVLVAGTTNPHGS